VHLQVWKNTRKAVIYMKLACGMKNFSGANDTSYKVHHWAQAFPRSEEPTIKVSWVKHNLTSVDLLFLIAGKLRHETGANDAKYWITPSLFCSKLITGAPDGLFLLLVASMCTSLTLLSFGTSLIIGAAPVDHSLPAHLLDSICSNSMLASVGSSLITEALQL
jgi:hypothetical protein